MLVNFSQVTNKNCPVDSTLRPRSVQFIHRLLLAQNSHFRQMTAVSSSHNVEHIGLLIQQLLDLVIFGARCGCGAMYCQRL